MISSLLLLLLMVSVGLVVVVLMVRMDDCYCYRYSYYYCSRRYSQHFPLPSDSQATSSATAIDSIDLPHQPAETKTAGCSCSAPSSPLLYYHHHRSYPCCYSPRQPAASTARPRSLPTGPRPLPLSRSGAALASVGPRSAAVPAGAPRATAILRWCWCWMMAGGRCRSWGSMLLLLS